MRTVASFLTLFVGVVLAGDIAGATTIDEALRLYKDDERAEAAFAFYDVMQTDANPDHRDQAEIYLAETLYKMKLYVPAMFYYTDLFKVGRSNRYYLTAVQGLLKVQKDLHDPLWVPSLVSEYLDPEGFGQLDPDKIAHINFMVGELSLRQNKNQDAQMFLEAVMPESSNYSKSRYLLGLIQVRQNNSEGALGHFNAVLDSVPEDASSEELRRVRSLALVAAGRVLYGMGRYAEASRHYKGVPRFSDFWFTSMYENAWSYYKQEEYGQALGELQSVTSPYFAAFHIPEAYVIQGTAYFVNCQWDRVRRAINLYKGLYEPMRTSLEGYLAQQREPVQYYGDVVAGEADGLALEIAREVRRSKRFRDYHFMIDHMVWEGETTAAVSGWRGTRLGEDIGSIIEQMKEQLEQVAGSWSRTQLKGRLAMLKNFQNQIDILDFEVANSEADWLEQGREILKGRRARLPRPGIPSDQWQHWGFDKEYWKGELGYYHHSLRSECD